MTRHRGRHPADEALFSAVHLPALRTAVAELSWLLERGYGSTGALKLVGDRHGLRQRQRVAVQRAACSDSARDRRRAKRLDVAALGGRELWIDGFNCIITLEAAMSGGLIFIGRDRAHRDLASVHGSYRRVHETRSAVEAIADLCALQRPEAVRWFLDRPVSNSAMLKGLIEAAVLPGAPWRVELVNSPDRALCEPGAHVVASSDSVILDRCERWVEVSGAIISQQIRQAWVVDLIA